MLPHRLISALSFFRQLHSKINVVSESEISNLKPSSVAVYNLVAVRTGQKRRSQVFSKLGLFFFTRVIFVSYNICLSALVAEKVCFLWQITLTDWYLTDIKTFAFRGRYTGNSTSLISRCGNVVFNEGTNYKRHIYVIDRCFHVLYHHANMSV